VGDPRRIEPQRLHPERGVAERLPRQRLVMGERPLVVGQGDAEAHGQPSYRRSVARYDAPVTAGGEAIRLEGLTKRFGGRAVDDALELTGLTEAAGRKVKTYSQGMRQRLGLAVALLRRPRLLVLDEPANGLDPAGIREFRDRLRSLGDDGVTVFISSHLLG